MNIINMKRILFFFVCVSLLLMSCKDKLSDTEELNSYINNWVYSNMSDLYYWNTTLPVYKSTTGSPADYFKSLKYKDDRFSAIFESYQDIANQLNGVSSAEIGFEFELYREGTSNVVGVVLYPKRGTPAEKMGIKRGDIFRKINGEQITMSNYNTVINYMYDATASSEITFATSASGVLTDLTPVTVTKVMDYKEDPVYIDTVYTVQNKKVGYLMYNFFTNDPGDKSLKYDLELNNIIGQFDAQGVSELIVDLRYNHGGAISSAIRLASMLVPNLTTDKVFIYTEYNKILTEYFKSTDYTSKYTDNPFVDNFATTIDVTSPSASYPIQNIGNKLQRIFFLTGTGTASASEMVINGLKPFLPAVLVGDTTVGKNVGSTLVNDTKNTKNQWAMLPIILKYFNKDYKSDFSSGFAPDFYVKDRSPYYYQLGDVREALLSKAISQISGIQTVSASKVQSIKRTFVGSSVNFKPIRNELIVRNKAIDSFFNRK